MSRFHATPQEIQAAQLNFDWLLPWGPGKQLLTTEEVGRCIGYTQDSVRNLIDSGKLETHQDNLRGKTNRLQNRVTRRSVAVYLMRTAKYGDDEIVGGVFEIWKTLTPAQRQTFLRKANDTARA